MPFQLGQNHVFSCRDEEQLAIQQVRLAPTKLLHAVRTVVTYDQVRFPSFLEVDDVKHGPPRQGLPCGVGTGVVAIAHQGKKALELRRSWVDDQIDVVGGAWLTVKTAA